MVQELSESKQYSQDLVESNERSAHQKFDFIQRELNAFKNTLDSIKDLQQSLAAVKQKLDEKASYQNLRNLEFQLEEYVKQVQFKEVISTLTNKADSSDFLIVTQQQNIIQSQLHLLKTQNQEYSDKGKQIEISFREQVKLIQTNIKEVEDTMKKNNYDINAKIVQAKELIRQNIKEQQLKEQERSKERDEWEFNQKNKFDKIHTLIESLATKDQLVKLKVEILPAIKDQTSMMTQFSIDNEQIKEMIRRFDEVISEKASKMSLHEVEVQIEKQYVKMKTWNTLQSQVNKSLEQQQENVVRMQDSVKNFEQNMSEEISIAVKKNLTKTMASYEKVLSQFSKFFDQEELNKILERKVDLEYVQQMGDVKANKIDVESCVSLIESVHERIKHMAILQVELAKVLIPVKTNSHFQSTETKNSKINRRDFLYRQAQLTSSWIGEFTVRQTYPGEEEFINSMRNAKNEKEQTQFGKEFKIIRKNIALNDVPSPIRAFERYHSQQIQEKTKQDLPQTLKRWKQQLNQKQWQQNQLQGGNSYQQMSITQSNFYNNKQLQQNQLEDYLKERQGLYQNQRINDSQKLNEQIHQKKIRKSYRSVRVSLNSSPQNQYNSNSNHTINDINGNSVSISAREVPINESQRIIRIGGQDLMLEELQNKSKQQVDQQDQTFLSTVMNENSIAENPSLHNFNYGLDTSQVKKGGVYNGQKRITIFHNNPSTIKVSTRSSDKNIDRLMYNEEQRQILLQSSGVINVNQIKVSSRGLTSTNQRHQSYNPPQQLK